VEIVQLSPWVTHERLDDEVIAINLENGAYYAFDGVAADCWNLVDQHAAPDDMVILLEARYPTGGADVRADVAAFVARLLEERLAIIPDSPVTPVSRAQLTLPERVDAAPRAYAAPVVERYNDLDDLLLLDPIHEVDEAGWPIAKAE
jgi:hypothetical protein